MFAAAGYPAIGTTSLGVAGALGLPDGAAETADATVELVHRLEHLPVHVTADIENGFSTDPAEVADYVARLGPLAGVNLEDQLGDTQVHAAVIAAVAGGDVFINARIDTYWLGRPDLTETLERAKRYVDAGADGIFVPGVNDEREIAALAEAIPLPLNVLFGAIPVPRLAALGVARISTGSLLYRMALGAAPPTFRDGPFRFRGARLRGRGRARPTDRYCPFRPLMPRRPSRAAAAGRAMPRTSVASIRTPAARATPIIFISISGRVGKMAKIATITTAALVMAPAVAPTPSAAAARGSGRTAGPRARVRARGSCSPSRGRRGSRTCSTAPSRRSCRSS